MVDHVEVDRETVYRSESGVWEGSVTCLCGWSRKVDNRVSREDAAVGLQAAWLNRSDAHRV